MTTRPRGAHKLSASTTPNGTLIREQVARLAPALEPLYRDLHAHPELSMQETRTAGIVAMRLRALEGWEVTPGIGKTGVVGVLRNGDGPVIGVRADMDALPVEEKTGLPYASSARGTDPDGNDVPVMHACGHDIHTTALLGAAEALARTRAAWRGTVVAIFQPGEESLAGAEAMLRDGLFTRFPRPDLLLGQHDDPFEVGTLLHRPGVLAAACTNLRVRIFGVGGHGASPESAVDPIVIAASAIVRLQTIAAREFAARDTPVVTVGMMRAGTRPNIIPEEVLLRITLRSNKNQALDQIEAAVRRIIAAEAQAGRSPRPPEIEVEEHTVVLDNDPALTARLMAAHRAHFGAERVLELPDVQTGSEDFSLFGLAGPDHFPPPNIPYCYWSFGATSPAVWAKTPGATPFEKAYHLPSPHSPLFAPDYAPTLRVATEGLLVAALEVLADPESNV
ncbi:MAG TPA: amidohydrolase [Ktedonobacterales bacterium]|jgi:hippurate hydrolase